MVLMCEDGCRDEYVTIANLFLRGNLQPARWRHKSNSPSLFTGGKKKKKAKGKTVGLSTFLSDPTTGSNFIKDPPKPSSSWADATEELDPSGGKQCS